MGHAITIHNPLRIHKTDIFEGIEAYECSGTPADCIKLAKHEILKDRKPDLVVSGINHGSNSAISILYSGTMSAAMEAAIEGFPAVGFSLCDYSADADFSHIMPFVKKIAENVLNKGVQKGIALNVNFPPKSDKPLKGIKICRQAHASWEEKFDKREDPHQLPYYWMTGDFVNYEEDDESTDEYALKHNYASIVPCKFDLTAYHALESMKQYLD